MIDFTLSKPTGACPQHDTVVDYTMDACTQPQTFMESDDTQGSFPINEAFMNAKRDRDRDGDRDEDDVMIGMLARKGVNARPPWKSEPREQIKKRVDMINHHVHMMNGEIDIFKVGDTVHFATYGMNRRGLVLGPGGTLILDTISPIGNYEKAYQVRIISSNGNKTVGTHVINGGTIQLKGCYFDNDGTFRCDGKQPESVITIEDTYGKNGKYKDSVFYGSHYIRLSNPNDPRTAMNNNKTSAPGIFCGLTPTTPLACNKIVEKANYSLEMTKYKYTVRPPRWAIDWR